MKGAFMLRVLDAVVETPRAFGDLLAIFAVPYGTSLRGMQRYLDERHRARAPNITPQQRRQFHNTLYMLRKQGLVRGGAVSDSTVIELTPHGRKKLKELRTHHKTALPVPRYVHRDERETNVVMFDVPEIYRRKRRWLRAALRSIGFTLIQKSVWIGTTALPETFIADLDRLRLLPYIKILAVTKKGNMETVM